MAPRIYVGRYDPKFIGATIRASSASDLHSFRYHNRSRPAPAALLAQLNDDAVISDLSRQTVLDHEVRHFRDSLLFPFGAATTRSRIHASYNGFQAAMGIGRLRGEANMLPVPLQHWLRMTRAERDTFISDETRFADFEQRPPQLPFITGDDLSSLAVGPTSAGTDEEFLQLGCRLALADYRMVERLWRSPYSEGDELICPAIDIWEAAGLICQFAAIERYAGEPLMQRFVDWVIGRGPKSYQRGLLVTSWCLQRLKWPPTMRNHLALVTWAEMGSFQFEREESSPAHRLAAIASAATRGNRAVEGAAFADLVKEWDEIVETDSFDALSAATKKFSSFCQRATEVDGMGTSLPASLFTSLADARRQMLVAFMSDPDSYVDPVAYLTQESRYPLPCVGLQYSSGRFGTDWTDVTPTAWSPAVSFDDTLSLVGMSLLSDALFLPGEKSMQDNGRLAIENMLGMRAVRIIR